MQHAWTTGACCDGASLAHGNATFSLNPGARLGGFLVHHDQATCSFLQPSAVLLFDPPAVSGQLEPCLHTDVWLRSATPVFSVIVNVYNHGFSIRKVLTQVIKLTTEPFELIVFLDGCSDNSVAEALAPITSLLGTAGKQGKGWPTCGFKAGESDPSREQDIGAECLVDGATSMVHFRAIVQPVRSARRPPRPAHVHAAHLRFPN